MKIIIDKDNPLTVLDQDGNVLFDYQPTTIKDIEQTNLDQFSDYLTQSIQDSYK